jgi:hypothetical protein
MDKVDGPEAYNNEWVNLEFLMDQTTQNKVTPDSLLSSRMDSQRSESGASWIHILE